MTVVRLACAYHRLDKSPPYARFDLDILCQRTSCYFFYFYFFSCQMFMHGRLLHNVAVLLMSSTQKLSGR